MGADDPTSPGAAGRRVRWGQAAISSPGEPVRGVAFDTQGIVRPEDMVTVLQPLDAGRVQFSVVEPRRYRTRSTEGVGTGWFDVGHDCAATTLEFEVTTDIDVVPTQAFPSIGRPVVVLEGGSVDGVRENLWRDGATESTPLAEQFDVLCRLANEWAKKNGYKTLAAEGAKSAQGVIAQVTEMASHAAFLYAEQNDIPVHVTRSHNGRPIVTYSSPLRRLRDRLNALQLSSFARTGQPALDRKMVEMLSAGLKATEHVSRQVEKARHRSDSARIGSVISSIAGMQPLALTSDSKRDFVHWLLDESRRLDEFIHRVVQTCDMEIQTSSNLRRRHPDRHDASAIVMSEDGIFHGEAVSYSGKAAKRLAAVDALAKWFGLDSSEFAWRTNMDYEIANPAPVPAVASLGAQGWSEITEAESALSLLLSRAGAHKCAVDFRLEDPFTGINATGAENDVYTASITVRRADGKLVAHTYNTETRLTGDGSSPYADPLYDFRNMLETAEHAAAQVLSDLVQGLSTATAVQELEADKGTVGTTL